MMMMPQFSMTMPVPPTAAGVSASPFAATAPANNRKVLPQRPTPAEAFAAGVAAAGVMPVPPSSDAHKRMRSPVAGEPGVSAAGGGGAEAHTPRRLIAPRVAPETAGASVPRPTAPWASTEIDALKAAVMRFGERKRDWPKVAAAMVAHGRDAAECRAQWLRMRPPVKGPWTDAEDQILRDTVTRNGARQWSHVAKHIPGRNAKQCRERWVNHLDPDVMKAVWTPEEDALLVRAQSELGNKWSSIARRLPGRSDNAVKNRWYTLQSRSDNVKRPRTRLPPLSSLLAQCADLSLEAVDADVDLSALAVKFSELARQQQSKVRSRDSDDDDDDDYASSSGEEREAEPQPASAIPAAGGPAPTATPTQPRRPVAPKARGAAPKRQRVTMTPPSMASRAAIAAAQVAAAAAAAAAAPVTPCVPKPKAPRSGRTYKVSPSSISSGSGASSSPCLPANAVMKTPRHVAKGVSAPCLSQNVITSTAPLASPEDSPVPDIPMGVSGGSLVFDDSLPALSISLGDSALSFASAHTPPDMLASSKADSVRLAAPAVGAGASASASVMAAMALPLPSVEPSPLDESVTGFSVKMEDMSFFPNASFSGVDLPL